jgi:ornithine cyclodeaminase
MKIINLDQIKETLKPVDIIPLAEKGFVAYAQRKTVTPPVGELLFKNPPGTSLEQA